MSASKGRRSVRHIMAALAASPEEDARVAKSQDLGTASEGDTPEEALHNIHQATLLYLNTLEEFGEPERTLKESRCMFWAPGNPV